MLWIDLLDDYAKSCYAEVRVLHLLPGWIGPHGMQVLEANRGLVNLKAVRGCHHICQTSDPNGFVTQVTGRNVSTEPGGVRQEVPNRDWRSSERIDYLKRQVTIDRSIELQQSLFRELQDGDGHVRLCNGA